MREKESLKDCNEPPRALCGCTLIPLSDYIYVYARPGSQSKSDTPVVWDKYPHRLPGFPARMKMYWNVLFLDGRVETLGARRFRELVGSTAAGS